MVTSLLFSGGVTIMAECIETIQIESFDSHIADDVKLRAINALEDGKVVYFPKLSFQLNTQEMQFLSPESVDPKSKNISYDINSDKLGGTTFSGDQAKKLKEMMNRYALQSRSFMEKLFPHYVENLTQARTSFRPVEIAGRVSSYRKDDTLLHVDSFPATPVKGKRIMRFFTNVNHQDKPRIWKVGEPFHNVVQKFGENINRPIPGLAFLLKLLGITKDYRSLYDHYMMYMHDMMKGDKDYQKKVQQKEIHFPPGSTWIVYTDQVSHAALSGQHVFEQTYYLPVEGLLNIETSPLRILERFYGKKLT